MKKLFSEDQRLHDTIMKGDKNMPISYKIFYILN